MDDYHKYGGVVALFYILLISIAILGLLVLVKFFLGFETAILFGVSLIIATIGYVTFYLVTEEKI
jgi:hypothetical protein